MLQKIKAAIARLVAFVRAYFTTAVESVRDTEERIEIRILRDGVFIASDIQKRAGDVATVLRETADQIIANGHAERV